MKNRQTTLLLCITLIFVGFTLGFLAGRSTASGDVIITTHTPATLASGRMLPVIEETKASVQRININTAGAALLDSLPGIGPELAQRIIDYREANGPFTSLSQLMLVEGIGESRLEAILDLITIE